MRETSPVHNDIPDLIERSEQQEETAEQLPGPPSPPPAGKRVSLFSRMLLVSLALHLVASLFALSPRGSSFKGEVINYVDLKQVSLPHPPAVAPPPAQPAAPAPDMAEPAEQPPQAPPPEPEPLSGMERLQQEMQKNLADAAANQEVLEQNSLGFGLSSGHFSSIAEGETLKGDIREYYFLMLRAINEKWWLSQPGQYRGVRDAIVNIVVARDGTVVMKQFFRGSGNRDFDKSILQAMEAASPLPPLPASYWQDFFEAPLRFVAPLQLLFP